MNTYMCSKGILSKLKNNSTTHRVTSKGDRSSTQYYNVQYTEGVACGYHKVEHLRLRIYSLHSTVLLLLPSMVYLILNITTVNPTIQ